MITKVQITDNSKLPLKYAKELDAFKNGKEYNFKGGVNVIIGKNGSGKTTLMKMIAMYMLCNDSLCSRLPNFANYGALKLNDIFKHDEAELLDGHGKNGAPYHIKDIVSDMEDARDSMKKLAQVFEKSV
jgi:predicted ATPase